jgi:adenosylcobinamide kinase/adenosylcobinamide-phosphate guanylyltransferase
MVKVVMAFIPSFRVESWGFCFCENGWSNNRMKIIFITGGARSGKSAFALLEASGRKGSKAYIATAEALDDEMKERIHRHKTERGNDWDTYEEPLNIADTLQDIKGIYNTILLDCLTLWLSNTLLRSQQPEESIDAFIDRLKSLHSVDGLHLYIVSNEVGMGIVPDNTLSRRFRDLAGTLNQRIAALADEVNLVIAGIPVKIK